MNWGLIMEKRGGKNWGRGKVRFWRVWSLVMRELGEGWVGGGGIVRRRGSLNGWVSFGLGIKKWEK